MSDELTTRLKSDNPRKGNNGMTTQPKLFTHTDEDGDKLEVQARRPGEYAAMLTINGLNHVWLTDYRAREFAQVILDGAGVRPFTDPEPQPKVEKIGSCYLVDGFHVCCGELNRTADDTRSAVEDAERKLAVLKFQLAEQEKAGQEREQEQKAADLAAHRDRVAKDIYGIPYDRLLSNPARAVRRIVELESAK